MENMDKKREGIHLSGKMKGIGSGKKWSCSKCGKSFPLLRLLREHEACVHSISWPYLCSKCGKKFKRLTTLRVHQRIHGTPDYPCTYCHRRFRQKSNLEKHMTKVCEFRERAMKQEMEQIEQESRRNQPASETLSSASDFPRTAPTKVAVLNPKRAMEILNNIGHSPVASNENISVSVFSTNMDDSSNVDPISAVVTPEQQRLPKVEHNTETILKYLKESPESTKNKPTESCSVTQDDSVCFLKGEQPIVTDRTELLQAVESISAISDHNYMVSPPKAEKSRVSNEYYDHVTSEVTQALDHVNPNEVDPESFINTNLRVINCKTELQYDPNESREREESDLQFVKSPSESQHSNTIKHNPDQTRESTKSYSQVPQTKSKGIVVQETILSSSCPSLELKPVPSQPKIHAQIAKCKQDKVRENLIYLINLMMEKKSRKLARTKVRNLLAETDAEKRILKYIQSQNQQVVPALSCDMGTQSNRLSFMDNTNVQSMDNFHLGNSSVPSGETSNSIQAQPLVGSLANQIAQTESSNQNTVSHNLVSNPSPKIIPALDSMGKTCSLPCSTSDTTPQPSIHGRPVLIKHISVDDADKMNKLPIYSSQSTVVQPSPATNIPIGIPSQQTVILQNGTQMQNCAIFTAPAPQNSGTTLAPDITSHYLAPNSPNTPVQLSQMNSTHSSRRPLRSIRPKPTPLFYVASSPQNTMGNLGQVLSPVLPTTNGISVTMVSQANTGITLTPVNQGVGSSITVTPVSNVNGGLALETGYNSVDGVSHTKQSSQNTRQSNVAILPKLATEEIESRYTKIKPKPPTTHQNNTRVTVTPVVVNNTFAIPEPPPKPVPSSVPKVSDDKRPESTAFSTLTDPTERHIVNIAPIENTSTHMNSHSITEPENRMDIVLASVNSLSNDSISSKTEDMLSDKHVTAYSQQRPAQFLNVDDSESYDFLSAAPSRTKQEQQGIHTHPSLMHVISEAAIDNTDKYSSLNQNNDDNINLTSEADLSLSFRQVIRQASAKEGVRITHKSPDKTMEQFIAKAPDSYFSSPERINRAGNTSSQADSTGSTIPSGELPNSKPDSSQDFSISTPNMRGVSDTTSSDRKNETTPTNESGDSPEVKRYQASPVKALDVENSNLSTASQGELWEILQSLLKDIPKQVSPAKSDVQTGFGRIGFSPIRSESRLSKTTLENESESGVKTPWSRVGFSPIKYLPHDLDVSSAINLAGVFSNVTNTSLEVSPGKTTTLPDTSPNKHEHDHKRLKTSTRDSFGQSPINLPTSDLDRARSDLERSRTDLEKSRLNGSFRSFDPELTETPLLMGETSITTVGDNRKESNTESDDVTYNPTLIGPDLIDENTMDKIIRVVEDLRALSNVNP